MDNRTLVEVIVYATEGLRLNRAKLEVEDKGRQVNTEQGLISGYNVLLDAIKHAFGVQQHEIDNIYDSGSVHEEVADMDDETLYDMLDNRNRLVTTDEWKLVLDSIVTKTEYEKEMLWEGGDSTRDLDLAHGLRDGMNCYKKFFDRLDNEREIREKKADDRRKKEALFGGNAAQE